MLPRHRRPHRLEESPVQGCPKAPGQRRRISLSIKQAAEGGIVASEYQEHFGEHAYDDEGNYIGSVDSGAEEAWAEYYAEHGIDPTTVDETTGMPPVEATEGGEEISGEPSVETIEVVEEAAESAEGEQV